MFQVIYQSKYGDTVESENPKLSAYRHMSFLKWTGIESLTLVIRDGHYTVQAQGLADITFAPVENQS